MSQDAISPQQFPKKYLYHEAHLNDRESIRNTGLRVSKPFNSWGDGSQTPPGVYLSQGRDSEYGSSMHDSSHFGYDRWRVNVGGLPIQSDPDKGKPSSRYTPEHIHPDRLKLVKKGNPDWERNI